MTNNQPKHSELSPTETADVTNGPLPVEKTLAGLEFDEQQAEEFAAAIIQRAASLQGVKIDRSVFLRTEIKKHCPYIDAEQAVASTLVDAGVSPSEIDAIALEVIDFETKKCAGLSFLAGIPGGIAVAGAVPADLAQYFAHVMRVEQKLAYLYGWQSFLNDDDEVDDETVMKLVVLMGVMLGVGGAANAVTKFAAKTARKGVEQAIRKQALTKTLWYTPMKRVLHVLGVNITKQTFARTASKVVPVVGGVISGGMTYASFKPGAEDLRRYLRSLPISGIDTGKYPDIIAIRADREAVARAQALQNAQIAAASTVHSIGSTVADGMNVLGSVASDAAQSAGAVMADAVQAAGNTAASAAQTAGKGALDALNAAGSFLSSLGKKSE